MRLCSELTLQLIQREPSVGVQYRRDRRCFGPCGTGRKALDLAHGHSATRNSPSKLHPFLRLSDGEKGSTVAGGKPAFFEQFLNRCFQPEKAQRICDGCAIFSRSLGYLFLRETKFVGEALKRARLFDRI